MSYSETDTEIFDQRVSRITREAAARRFPPIGYARPRQDVVTGPRRARRERVPSRALTNVAWFAGLYGASVLSFGALVGGVRWTLALV